MNKSKHFLLLAKKIKQSWSGSVEVVHDLKKMVQFDNII